MFNQRAPKKQRRGGIRVWAEANKLRMKWCSDCGFPFSFFSYKKFSDKQNEFSSRTNSVRALFAAQNTLQNDKRRVNVLKPEAPFGRRKRLPAAGSAAKVPTNKRMMKNENS